MLLKSVMKIGMVSLLALSTSGCLLTQQGGPAAFCRGENAPLCMFMALAVGGVSFALMAGSSIAGAHVIHHGYLLSDERLKTDVQFVDTLENGVRLHAFRYKGDERVFLGALAQELLEDSRHRHAVQLGEEGLYRVNYAKLGLTLVNPELMADAGEAAAARLN